MGNFEGKEKSAGKYGDFEEVRKVETSQNVGQEVAAPVRLRMPYKGEFIGVVVQRLGGNRMEILTTENKRMNCRVPGRFKRKFWLRPKDVVIVEPWENDSEKGDIIYQYSPGAISQLRKKGILSSIKEEF